MPRPYNANPFCRGRACPALDNVIFATPPQSVMMNMGSRAGMKSICCTVWVLGAMLVVSSLDTRPDPPAVNPHAVNIMKSSCLREGSCEFQQERLSCAASCSSPGRPIRWVAVAQAYEPKSATDRIALSGHAADPSPPARAFLHKPPFQS